MYIITGFFNIALQMSSQEQRSLVLEISRTLYHRGPDDGGLWIDAQTAIALGHRRLAIVDVSSQGYQQILYKYVPQKLVDRPKQGFCLPIDSCLRGPLRDWAETLLDEKRLCREGFLSSTYSSEAGKAFIWRKKLGISLMRCVSVSGVAGQTSLD